MKLFVQLTSIEIANAHETIKASDLFDRLEPGAMVAVRPCGKEHEGKTFLGMYLCAAPTTVYGEQKGDKIIIAMGEYTNPAIYVPELKKIVWGYESWWGEIKSKEDLHQITDEDINNCWYVRALKQLEAKAAEPQAPVTEPAS